MEQNQHGPEIRNVNSASDYNEIAKSLLDVIAANESGAMGPEIIVAVHQTTGFDPAEIGQVFHTFVEEGVVERTLDPVVTNGVTLTARGQHYRERFDELMGQEPTPEPDTLL